MQDRFQKFITCMVNANRLVDEIKGRIPAAEDPDYWRILLEGMTRHRRRLKAALLNEMNPWRK